MPAANLGERVYSLSRALSHDPDPQVAAAARYVWQALTDAQVSLAREVAGALQIVNVCGNRFRVTNTSELALSVELTRESGTAGVRQRIPANGSSEIELPGDNPVRLRFAGRDVGTASKGKQGCPTGKALGR